MWEFVSHAGANAQNACNLLWAMSTTRVRPSATFTRRMQQILLNTITKEPQNIGDMVQALAVLRRPAVEGLLDACDGWMRSHCRLLLPNHILAYLNVRFALSGSPIHSLTLRTGRHNLDCI
jgi:hypothetical protein